MHAVETYIRELRDIRATGSALKETSYYSPLSNLFNDVGRGLKPRVRCINFLKNRGAGIPDFGLFTADQLQRASGDEPLPGQPPSRGVIEVKSTAEEIGAIVASEQVLRYLAKYGLVLVTNYRDFTLVGVGPGARPAALETYRLAADERSFWSAAANPGDVAAQHGERLVEYLRRVMWHAAPLTDPADVAWFLASYARDARMRIEHIDVPALATVRAAMEQALGIAFEGERGDHFFRSTLVQTLFYGIFSAWVLWHGEDPERTGSFDWRTAPYYLHVPVIQALFEQVSGPSRLRPLGLMEVLDWTGAALNRVVRGTFFRKFDLGQAVQYFYEPFLQAFDPELRKDLGVWYTPTEIVHYMVARVDTVLREELGIADGLADPRVVILDPCCGTGAYLVEVLRHIAATLQARGGDALLGEDLKRAAMQRVFGFELLPAPFVVAHLQLGLLLQQLGAPLSDAHDERAGVYLTNALTGWDPAQGPKQHLIFPELEAERDAADRVKREAEILVILGNPPYNGFAGLAMAEERDLSTAYRATKRAPAPQGQGLNDLYVRFFRMAERRIVERTGKGIVCFISNYSWLDGLSFTGMRERYLEAFDRIWIDNLHGDRIISEYAPDRRTSETVFAQKGTSPGIKVGTAISLLVTRGRSNEPKGQVCYRDMDQARAAERREALLEGLGSQHFDECYLRLVPVVGIGIPFKPRAHGQSYFEWRLLPDLFPVSFPGVKTSRDDVVVDIDRERLIHRMRQYFDPAISHAEMARLVPGAMANVAGFNSVATREYLCRRGFLPENIVPYCYRPFDVRWLYWEPETKLVDRSRSEYFPHVFEGNLWLSSGQRNRKEAFYQPQVTSLLADHHIVESNVGMFPLYLRTDHRSRSLFEPQGDGRPVANVSSEAAGYIEALGASAADLFHHSLADLHAPLYRVENAGALRQDWPRIPLPTSKEALLASAALGRQVAALLDSEQAVAGVTTGLLRPELQAIGPIAGVAGRQLSSAGDDLAVTAGWGHAGSGGVTMPGKGRVVERTYTPEERAAIATGAEALGMAEELALQHLGAATCDVYLNGVAYWRNVPRRVWDYTIGGYQVIKKWLSYREHALLGRALTPDEAREVTRIARRIAAIRLLEPELDASYRAVKQATYAWPAAATP